MENFQTVKQRKMDESCRGTIRKTRKGQNVYMGPTAFGDKLMRSLASKLFKPSERN